jgi:hypothetical protein
MNPKTVLGFILVGIGALFLISGLFVMIFVTVINGDMAADLPPVNPTIWESFANRVMDFTIQLLEVDWTPTRVGVFLIIIGLVLEGGGTYVLVAKNNPVSAK